MLKSKPLPPIHPMSSRTSVVTFRDFDDKALLPDGIHPSDTHPNLDEHEASHAALKATRGLMNRPVFSTQSGALMTSTARPEEDVAALSASLSTRCPLAQDPSTKDFKRSRTMYTTNATLVNRTRRTDVRTEKSDYHKRHPNRRRKEAAFSLNRGSNHSFPPGKVIKRNEDNSVIPQMFPKIRRVDRGGPCPTQLYTKTKLSYSGKINGSVQLDHYVRRNSRPRIEPLRVPSTSTGTSGGGGGGGGNSRDDSLDSVISSSKMTLEGRAPAESTSREWPSRGVSPLFKHYTYGYFDEEPSVPPNSEIGPSRMQMVTPYEQ